MDTYKAVKALTAVGFTESQAETLVTTVTETIGVGHEELATKTDIADLRTELQALEIRMMRMHVASVAATVGLVVALIKLLP
ncbi:MAG: hypothetical protein OXM03_04505 [Chloroflexota bacterium]|nr:hypothetical protein [Chloroflexota bacterium]MDE2839870.1 hypothetical protein [Chloroflexota bacterium]MDE2929753.1 hypothetical protein [Chloroflexota bacterium]